VSVSVSASVYEDSYESEEDQITYRNLRTTRKPIGHSNFPSILKISNDEINGLVNIINEARSNVVPSADSMKKMTFSYELYDALVEFLLTKNSGFLFENDTSIYKYKVFGTRYPMTGYGLLKRPEFKSFSSRCRYFFHDTTKSSKNSIYNIFRFRIVQKKCFNYYLCSKNETSNYFSCNIFKNSDVASRNKCSWVHRYYGHIIKDNQDSFACVRVNHPGPYTPRPWIQTESFWCFSCNNENSEYNNDYLNINDIPYTKGQYASNCPTGYKKSGNLCSM